MNIAYPGDNALIRRKIPVLDRRFDARDMDWPLQNGCKLLI